MTAPYAAQPDEFAIDAARLGVTYSGYSGYKGCITGCYTCRNFRNAVRAAREEEARKGAFDSIFNSYRLGVDTPIEFNSYRLGVDTPIDIDELDAERRIALALHIAEFYPELDAAGAGAEASRLVRQLLS